MIKVKTCSAVFLTVLLLTNDVIFFSLYYGLTNCYSPKYKNTKTFSCC